MKTKTELHKEVEYLRRENKRLIDICNNQSVKIETLRGELNGYMHAIRNQNFIGSHQSISSGFAKVAAVVGIVIALIVVLNNTGNVSSMASTGQSATATPAPSFEELRQQDFVQKAYALNKAVEQLYANGDRWTGSHVDDVRKAFHALAKSARTQEEMQYVYEWQAYCIQKAESQTVAQWFAL